MVIILNFKNFARNILIVEISVTYLILLFKQSDITDSGN
jgi:hypothetical protein